MAESNKRKPAEKLSGAARRKILKQASLEANAKQCLKLTTFITKLPTASENVGFSGDLLECRCASAATEQAATVELGLQPKRDEEAINQQSRPSSANEVLEFDEHFLTVKQFI